MYAGGSRKQGHVSALTSREGVRTCCVDRASGCVGKASGHADRTARHERGARAQAGASRALMVGYARERVECALALAAVRLECRSGRTGCVRVLEQGGDDTSWVIHLRGQGEFKLLTTRDKDMLGTIQGWPLVGTGETNKRGRISAGRMCECAG